MLGWKSYGSQQIIAVELTHYKGCIVEIIGKKEQVAIRVGSDSPDIFMTLLDFVVNDESMLSISTGHFLHLKGFIKLIMISMNFIHDA
mgnify:CR=1 FL=1